MAIAFDAASSLAFGATASWSHTAASGSVLWVAVRDDGNNVTGCTWDGNALTLSDDLTMSSGHHHKLYWIDNIGNSGGPAAGTKTIAISAGGNNIAAEATSFSGFSGFRIGLDAHAKVAATTGTTIQQAITTGADNCWYVVAVQDYSGTSPTVNAAWTARVQAGGGASSNFGDSNGVVHPAGTVTPIANVTSAGGAGILVAAFYIAPVVVNQSQMFAVF